MKVTSVLDLQINESPGSAKYTLPIQNLLLSDLAGQSGECVECLGKIQPGEDVVLLMQAVVNTDGTIHCPLDNIKISHIVSNNTHFCLEDFIERLLQNKKNTAEIEKQVVSDDTTTVK